MDMKSDLTSKIEYALTALGLPVVPFTLEHPETESFGDYAANIALVLYPQVKDKFTNPRDLAQAIAGKLTDVDASVSIAGPGFINFTLKSEYFVNLIPALIQAPADLLPKTGLGRTVIIDYSSPNIAKRFSIGHLRSTIIGQALANLYAALGWRVIGDNHLGDWGTQFGKMIVAAQKWAHKPIDALTVDEMEQLYVKFHQEAETDPRLDEAARASFKKLESGDPEYRAMWQQFVDASMKEFNRLYDLLDVHIDEAYGESAYESIMPTVIKDAKQKGLAVESQNALVIPFPQDVLPPGMLLKSDGATTYFTRDLATIKFRRQKWMPDLLVYEVGGEQQLHFKQVFMAAEMLGYKQQTTFVHVPHGLIRHQTGRMSTRKGTTIKLDEVLAEALKRAKTFNPDEAVATVVGVGAVKYNDLKRSPDSGYVFDWDEVLNLEGNSGPYVQYCYARACSVLAKSGQGEYTLPDGYQPNPEELRLLKWLARYPEMVVEAAKTFSPHTVAGYVNETAQRFNTFYNKHSILGSTHQPVDTTTRNFRLSLTAATAQVLKHGLHLLGIQAPATM